MRGFLVTLALVIAAAVLWPKRRARVAEPEPVLPAAPWVEVQAPAPTAPAPVSPAAPRVEKTAEAFDPYTVDRFSLRKLDNPLPRTVAELYAKLTRYRKPMLPAVLPGQEHQGDGDVLLDARGFYEDGELRPIFIRQDTGGVRVAFAKGDWVKARRRSFDHDPYSLALDLDNGMFLYLKFRSQLAVPGVDHKCRAMVGWVFANRGSERAMRLAAIEFDAPSAEMITAVLPDPLPAN